MKTIEEVRKSERTDELTDELVSLWRRSVTASHRFLRSCDIDSIEPEARCGIREVETLYVARTDTGAAAGFAGVQDKSLEMLFVDAVLRGSGCGSALIDRANEDAEIEFVDVNEDNPRALEFYCKKGFRVESRSAQDSSGRPYPVLHMRRKLQHASDL